MKFAQVCYLILFPHLSYLLGSDKPTTYTILLQNDTEIRANGGFAGSYAKITISNPASLRGAVGDAAISSAALNPCGGIASPPDISGWTRNDKDGQGRLCKRFTIIWKHDISRFFSLLHRVNLIRNQLF